MAKKVKIAKVQRITIDERLSEDLIRLEICKLIKVGESGEFKDEPDFWKDIVRNGNEILARPINPKKKSKKDLYTDWMSIPESQVKQFPWKDLKEGQVYLSGEFEIKEEQDGDKNVKRYFTRPGVKAFEQIDDDVKENTKTLYYEILAKGEKNAKL
ncbi:hypothetical protein JW935_27565 [candidate division KSB1 bacterium]|nr:hypothetical protein [candidate division KSB1 bacterium]